MMTDLLCSFLINVRHWFNRRRANLLLLLALTALVSTWFHRHLHLYVTEIFVIGGSLSLWGLWQLLLSTWKQGQLQDNDSHLEALLDSSKGTEHLLFGLVLFSILSLMTSSVYLIHQGTNAKEEKIVVEVHYQGQRLLKDSILYSYDRVAGRPITPEWIWKRELSFEVTSPAGFKPLIKELYPWTSLHINVPDDFEQERLISLFPLGNLYHQLPSIEDSGTQVRYDLELSQGRSKKTILDIRRQTIQTGSEVMERVKKLYADEHAQSLRNHIKQKALADGMPLDNAGTQKTINNLTAKQNFRWEQFEPNASEKLHIRIDEHQKVNPSVITKSWCFQHDISESPHVIILLDTRDQITCNHLGED